MLSTAVPKPLAPDALKARLRRLQARADREVYAYVAARDRFCRACDTWMGKPHHRHHLIGRVSTTRETVCLLCEDCHSQTHVRLGGKTLRITGNAEQRDASGRPNGLTVERRIKGAGWITWSEQ